jgi:hypothetical protein
MKTAAGRVVFMEGMRAHDQHSSRDDVAPLSLQPSPQPSQPANWAADSRLMQTPHLPPKSSFTLIQSRTSQPSLPKWEHAQRHASLCHSSCRRVPGQPAWINATGCRVREARLVCHKCATAMTPQFMAQVAALRNRSAIHTSLSTQSEKIFCLRRLTLLYLDVRSGWKVEHLARARTRLGLTYFGPTHVLCSALYLKRLRCPVLRKHDCVFVHPSLTQCILRKSGLSTLRCLGVTWRSCISLSRCAP